MPEPVFNQGAKLVINCVFAYRLSLFLVCVVIYIIIPKIVPIMLASASYMLPLRFIKT